MSLLALEEHDLEGDVAFEQRAEAVERSMFRHSTTSSRFGAVPVTSQTTSPTSAV